MYSKILQYRFIYVIYDSTIPFYLCLPWFYTTGLFHVSKDSTILLYVLYSKILQYRFLHIFHDSTIPHNFMYSTILQYRFIYEFLDSIIPFYSCITWFCNTVLFYVVKDSTRPFIDEFQDSTTPLYFMYSKILQYLLFG